MRVMIKRGANKKKSNEIQYGEEEVKRRVENHHVHNPAKVIYMNNPKPAKSPAKIMDRP